MLDVGKKVVVNEVYKICRCPHHAHHTAAEREHEQPISDVDAKKNFRNGRYPYIPRNIGVCVSHHYR